MNQNPYRAPIDSGSETINPAITDRAVEFKTILLKWERYRLVYNLALVATTVFTGLAFEVSPLSVEFWFVLVAGALMANLLFMLGPSLDGYSQVAGFRHPIIGLFVFGCGTLVAVSLAALTVASLGENLPF